MKKTYLIFIFLFIGLATNKAQSKDILSQKEKEKIESYLTKIVANQTRTPKIKIDSTYIQKSELHLVASIPLSYIGFDKDLVKNIYTEIEGIIENKKYSIKLHSDGYEISDYIPFNRKSRFTNKLNKPLVSNLSKANEVKKGLTNRHIALWQSHGWYYNQKQARWQWQRARIFQTVEDLYTQSYVLPFLVPMLENAGANLLLPRERDTNRHEIIIDQDTSLAQSTYAETIGKETWTKGHKLGFAHLKESYMDGENPFKMGSYRQVKTIKSGQESRAEWIASIPEKGEYAVYVSYQSVKNSSDDALYTIHHLGGDTEFSVNQTMGGGTWIFLGFFPFDQNKNIKQGVSLSNKSSKAGKILTADAIKIGGGMGNIARLPSELIVENGKSSEETKDNIIEKRDFIPYVAETSSYPRYTEAARYWMQWAGIPDTIYNRNGSKNDYTDDYQSRGYWVNHIAGGSTVLPKKEGLNIPIDMAMAFHSDAGTTLNDSIIGTLLICKTDQKDGKFANKQDRLASRDLASFMMNDIVNDIRVLYEPNWTRRHIWNRPYSEAYTPEVPTALLELLSHQNFADMRYGLDPEFQFHVSRAIYKSFLRFLSAQYKLDYVVQPLPIKEFSSRFASDTEIELSWQATNDPLEETAKPDAYIVYTRIGEGGFDNGQLVRDNQFRTKIERDRIYSYKITAVNDGGESFPSEILSASRKSNERAVVLVINGFERVSAPHSFGIMDSIAGFANLKDHGVPYINQYNYIGTQYEYRREIPWMHDDASGFGASNSNYETMLIAGNNFDYPYMHGLSITDAGFSFISTSTKAVMSGVSNMNDYPIVDLILGKQKKHAIGNKKKAPKFKTFPNDLQNKISEYCKRGGHIFASGAHIATDLWDNGEALEEDKKFATDILKFKWRVGQAAVNGKVKTVASPFPTMTGEYSYHDKLNTISYAVEAPDAIEPADGSDSYTSFRYSESGISAGINYAGSYKTCIIGFPFETIKTREERNQLMKNILLFFADEKPN